MGPGSLPQNMKMQTGQPNLALRYISHVALLRKLKNQQTFHHPWPEHVCAPPVGRAWASASTCTWAPPPQQNGSTGCWGHRLVSMALQTLTLTSYHLVLKIQQLCSILSWPWKSPTRLEHTLTLFSFKYHQVISCPFAERDISDQFGTTTKQKQQQKLSTMNNFLFS